MNNLERSAAERDFGQQLRDMNEALLISSVRQHELTDQAQQAEADLRETQEELRRNAEAFSKVVEQSPYGIYVVDSQFRIAQVSVGAHPAFRNVRPLIGCDFAAAMRTLWPEPFASEAIAIFRRTLETGELYISPGLTEHRRDVEATESYEWQTHRVMLADGKFGVVCYFFDTTRLRQAELASAHLAAIVTCSEDAIISKDLAGLITSWNKGAEHLFGYAAEEIIGQPVTLLIPEDRVLEEPQILERIRRGEAIEHYETVRRRKDGTLLDISLTVSPLKDAAGRIIGASKIARDITDRKRLEATLRESEARFRTLADSTPALVWVNGPDGCEFVNRQYLEFLGVTSSDVQGFGWAQFIHPQDRAEYVNAYLRAVDQRAVFDAEFRFRRHDGEYRWMRSVAQPRLGQGNEFRGYSGVTIDDTEQRRAETALRESEERYRALFDLGPVAVYSCDAAGVIQNFNPRAAELWGREPAVGDTDERFCGSFKMFRPEGSLMPHDQCPMAEVLSGQIEGVRDAEVLIERPDGSRVNVLVNIRPVKDEGGEIRGAINCFSDITERSLLEQKTREQAKALADLSRRKDEFLAMLSHELRNPLAPIMNAVQLLRLQQDRNPLQMEAHGMIERQVAQLARLVDDLLEVSRISTGRVHLQMERVDLRGIVLRAVEATNPQCGQKGQSVAKSLPAEPVWVHGDSMRLEQVVVNLLNNACKYTDRGGHIWIGLAQKGEEAELRVRDNGIGIAPDLLPQIFDLFTQADKSLDRAQGGLGIGLSLVQSLVTMHHGRVEALSMVGQGSEFIVRLPVLFSLGVATSALALDVEQPTHSLKVLVVDDNADAAKGIARLLQSYGHETRMAHEGAAAMQAALEFVPDVVLLDIGLPVINGYQVAKWIRQELTLQNAVLVALTGYGQESDRQRAQEAGFDHHLVKPADFKMVQRILAEVSMKAL